jgi:two-component sensor histidine kinase
MSCYRLLTRALPDDEVVESVDHLHLEPLPRVVQSARAFVRDRLPDTDADTLDTILLLTSELVTNAVIHARTAIEVGITVTTNKVLITVHDEDLGHPSDTYPGREGGRGLGLVAAMSEETATERHVGEGKTVWFRLARRAASEVTA